MRFFPAIRVVPLVLAAAALAACGSTGGSAGGGGGGSGSGGGASGGATGGGELPAGVRAVSGNCQVVVRTWNPKQPSAAPTTVALVNASSEAGRKLSTGRASSTVVRVVTDEQMGALLAALDEKGFSAHAARGLTLDGIAPSPARRGVLVVEQDGASRGIDFQLEMGGTPIPKVFTECKQIVFAVHQAIPGFEVRASTSGSEDPSRVFQAPPARLNR